MYVDSHCHLNYLKSSLGALERARSSGVDGVLCIGVDEVGIDEVLAVANANDDVWASVGLHPQSAEQDFGLDRRLSLALECRGSRRNGFGL